MWNFPFSSERDQHGITRQMAFTQELPMTFRPSSLDQSMPQQAQGQQATVTMNGDVPNVPITTLAGIASLTDRE